ncbi:uncharacterized protein FIESC28_01752 [Fusarium coffeatum]|uniref:Uncharacterized protein n=1 Tax=Fusarium coffeatum TaxID=231269 RepID=A0A366S877_9HYPO|nr:uncharacterized protein FIESC28_01752 [Fusarium coffeatum]RBR25514.1 hypothetical protein FIESC28_01752 [Fusarium coffeatum]
MDREEFEEPDTNRTMMPKTQNNAEDQYETKSETQAGPEEEEVASHDEFEIRPIVNPRAGAAATWNHESVITLLAYIEWCVESDKDFRTEGLLLLSQELGTSIKRSKRKAFDIWVKHKSLIQSVRDRVREIRPTTGSSALSTETTPTRRRLVTIKVRPSPTKPQQVGNTGDATIDDSQEEEDPESPDSPAHTVATPGSSHGTIDVANDAASNGTHDLEHDEDLDAETTQGATADANPQISSSPPSPGDPDREEDDSFDASHLQLKWLHKEPRRFSFTSPSRDQSDGINEAPQMDNCRQDLVDNTHTQPGMVGSLLDCSQKSLRLDLFEEKRKRSLCEEEIRTQCEKIAELEGELRSLKRCKPDANVRHNLEQHFVATRAMIGENNLLHRKIEELSLSDIRRRIIALSNAIRDFGLTNEEISDELPDLESIFGLSVQSWATRAFGKNIRLCIYSVYNQEFRKEGLLRGLLAAAINELIFEPVFPHIFNVYSQDTNFYRKYIVVQHGTEDLHHADHHVLKELARDKQTAMIEPTANSLADRISKNLEGLFSRKEDQPAQQHDLDGDSDMLFPESDVDTTTLHLRSVLSQAMSLKLDLTMHMNRLRFFFFKPNDLWDAQNMKLDDPSFQPDEGSSIKACISPAIYVAPKREINRDEAILEFDTRFNTYFLEATEDEAKTLELVSQAIVLI